MAGTDSTESSLISSVGLCGVLGIVLHGLVSGWERRWQRLRLWIETQMPVGGSISAAFRSRRYILCLFGLPYGLQSHWRCVHQCKGPTLMGAPSKNTFVLFFSALHICQWVLFSVLSLLYLALLQGLKWSRALLLCIQGWMNPQWGPGATINWGAPVTQTVHV